MQKILRVVYQFSQASCSDLFYDTSSCTGFYRYVQTGGLPDDTVLVDAEYQRVDTGNEIINHNTTSKVFVHPQIYRGGTKKECINFKTNYVHLARSQSSQVNAPPPTEHKIHDMKLMTLYEQKKFYVVRVIILYEISFIFCL